MCAAPPEAEPANKDVFLNIPYDWKFHRLYLAYITGLVHLGLRPRATIEIPGGRNRIDKIVELIRNCSFSIHDLSRVEVDRTPPATPRFNMPFELGIAVAFARMKREEGRETFFLFESVNRRVAKSLSDLRGVDEYIHEGRVAGVMRELCNAFVRESPQERSSVEVMLRSYRRISALAGEIQRQSRAKSLFEASVFRRLYFAAHAVVAGQEQSKKAIR